MAKLESGNVHDWASKAAERIFDEFADGHETDKRARVKVSRVAAIIATYAEPLLQVLREARRSHHHDAHGNEYDVSSGCCPRCNCLDGEHPNHYHLACTCGADAWNAKIDAILAGRRLLICDCGNRDEDDLPPGSPLPICSSGCGRRMRLA